MYIQIQMTNPSLEKQKAKNKEWKKEEHCMTSNFFHELYNI